MSDWSQGYVAELDYTYGYYRELNPALLNFVALCKGRRAPDPSGDGLAYCELGCGQGYAVNLLAAANPNIDFHANDFNPPQIAGARRLAAEGGLSNAHFSDASFQDYIDDPALPQFDYIVLHGIYSWISPENRQAILAFLRRKLKVGGLVFISYNTLPGWAAGAPLQRLIWEHGQGSGGPMLGRLDKALAFAERLKQAGAGYFRDVHGAAPRLEAMAEKSRNYLVHEYFSRDWSASYFADVAHELAGAKLDYVGSAWIFDHVDDVNLTAENRAMLGEVADPIFRETVRDYLTMNQFRRDIFGRGSLPLSTEERRQAWLNLRLALSMPRKLFPNRIKSRVGDVALRAELYGPILDALAEGPRTLREMMTDPKVAALGSDARLIEVIQVIIGVGGVQPCPPLEGEAARRKSVKALNTAILKRALSSDQLGYLASPVVGGGQIVDQLPQLFLLGLQEKVEDVPAFAYEALRAQNRSLTRDGQTLVTPEDNLAEMRDSFAKFTAAILPIAKQLAVV